MSEPKIKINDLLSKLHLYGDEYAYSFEESFLVDEYTAKDLVDASKVERRIEKMKFYDEKFGASSIKVSDSVDKLVKSLVNARIDDYVTHDLGTTKLRNFVMDLEVLEILKTIAPFSFVSILPPSSKCEYCDLCGKKDHLTIWKSSTNVDVHLCLSGNCGKTLLGEAVWSDALFSKASTTWGKPLVDKEAQDIVNRVRRYVREGFAPPIVCSIVEWYDTKGYITDKQTKVLNNFLQDR